MENLEFGPTKTLLVFRLVGVAVSGMLIGGLAVGVCVGGELGASAAAVFGLGFLVPCVVFGAYTVLFFFSIRYKLDDRYISSACGVIWRQRRSVPLEKITNLDVWQGPFERIFGYGKVWIFTPSTGAAMPEEQLVGVPKPHDIKQAILQRSEMAKLPQVSAAEEETLQSKGKVVSLLTEIRNSLQNIEASLSQQKDEA